MQYVAFYSSARFWIENRDGILHDQVEIFRRGVNDARRRRSRDAALGTRATRPGWERVDRVD